MGKVRFQYSPNKMARAIEECRSGMKVRQAAARFKVPKSTLWEKLKGIAPLSSGSTGFKSHLGDDIEEALEEWILKCSRMGFPITKNQLMDSVKKIVNVRNLATPFTSGKPGRKWYYSFLKRHRRISQKHAEYVNAARGSVTKEKIQEWFDNVKDNLKDDFEILKEPSRVWNMDETCFNLAPSGKLVLAEKGATVYSKHSRSDKENITTLIGVNAEGLLAPPLTLYKFERIPVTIARLSPSYWVLGKSETGWMNSECFFEYMANNFNSFLIRNNIQKPVIVFLDGHRSHLSLHLGKFCKDNGIILIALYPNSTHLLQPLDVAVFSSLKAHWKTVAFEWRINNEGAEIDKKDVPRVLDGILKGSNFKANAIAGFKKTGLFPFDKNAPDYKRICEINKNQDQDKNTKALGPADFKHFESKIPIETMDYFKRTEKRNHDWEGPPEASMLYDVWLALKKETEKKYCTQSQIPETHSESGTVSNEIENNVSTNSNVSVVEGISPLEPNHTSTLDIHQDINTITVQADVHATDIGNLSVVENQTRLARKQTFTSDIHPDINTISITKDSHTISVDSTFHNGSVVDSTFHSEQNNKVMPKDINQEIIDEAFTEESNTQSTSQHSFVDTPIARQGDRVMPVRNLEDVFKDILRYPPPPKRVVPPRKKFLPSILTSDEVLLHEQLKIDKKNEAEQIKKIKKEDRLKKAEEKKILKATKQQRKPKKVKTKGEDIPTGEDIPHFSSQPTTSQAATPDVDTPDTELTELIVMPGKIDEIRILGCRGLCFKCGNGIKISDYGVPCMICSKLFHENCVINELEDQEDQTDLVFICNPCLNAVSDTEIDD